MEHLVHEIDAVFDGNSRVLVLGTFPSPKSRESGFFYGNPQNRFWKVLAALFDEPMADTIDRKKCQLLRRHIALWDVLSSCSIEGASDASIADAAPNDLRLILDAAPIEAVFCNGAKAYELFRKFWPQGITAVTGPDGMDANDGTDRTGSANTNATGSAGEFGSTGEVHVTEATGMPPVVKLPSTSPANASFRLNDLVDSWGALLPHLHEFEPPVLDVPDVVALEHAIDESGTSLRELMDRAGTFLAHRVHKLSPDGRIAILCGSGNNGGDGWVAARELSASGHVVTLISRRNPEDLKAEPARTAALEIKPLLQGSGVETLINPEVDELVKALEDADVVVDAILGTGFAGNELRAPYDTWIAEANRRCAEGALLVAADVPSGLSAQTGAATDPCISADETVTMIVPKPALSDPRCGRVTVAGISYIEPFFQ